ncbi:MAG: transglutaminase-like domain-containing protein, partial [Longimicrobiales bacterium]
SLGGLHWRGRSYDRFDGVRWHRSEPGPYGLPLARSLPPGERVHQLVYARTLPTNPIFGLHPIADVQPRSRIWPVREVNGDIRYLGRGAPVYLVVSAARSATPAELRAASTRVPRRMMHYLQLPALPDRIGRLADSLSLGAASNYDRAIRIEQYLRTRFAYTRELPATARETSIDYFLFERRAGHCEYFSTAMVLLLRSLGVPARNVNGFLGGEWNDFGNYLAVSQNNAHSWVEVWFPEVGWVEFDPTPTSAAGSVASSAAAPWFAWLDGFEHRWNKWVLDYALEDQIRLLERVRGPFADDGVADTVASSDGALWRRLATWVIPLAALVMAAWLLLLRRRRPPDTEPARSYRRLRRAYAGAGFDAESTAPRAFIAGLQHAGAPGHTDARAAVELYLRGRFSARPLAPAEHAQFHACVHAARAALRAAGSARAGRSRARERH